VQDNSELDFTDWARTHPRKVLSEVEVTVNKQVCQLKLLELEFDSPALGKLTGL
jgi:hypothetical protein